MVAAAGAVEDAIRVGGLADIKAARIKVQTTLRPAPYHNVMLAYCLLLASLPDAEPVCLPPVWGPPALPQRISACPVTHVLTSGIRVLKADSSTQHIILIGWRPLRTLAPSPVLHLTYLLLVASSHSS